MGMIEFEVSGTVPPRNVGKQSMWNDDTEVPRVIELRRSALESWEEGSPVTTDVRLTIEIHIPEDYNEPGDLDNFIKGICDSLRKPREALINPNFPIHDLFKLPENGDVSPKVFEVIRDDSQIVEIRARLKTMNEGGLHYRVMIESI